MILDSKQQRENMVKAVHSAAATLPRDASDYALSNLAVLVRLRQEVEGAMISGEAVVPHAPG